MNNDVIINVSLTTKTCIFGHFYAVPYWMTDNYRCPMCASGELAQRQLLIHSLEKTISANVKSIAALKGAITRKKRK